MHSPLRLRCDGAALAGNYHALSARAGVAAGAAVKANAYGLGAKEVVKRLWSEGCRDFFVSSWCEAAELHSLPAGSLSVLHGFGPDDALIEGVRPVLVSTEQVQRWREGGHSDLPCDVMVDTGMSRLGLHMDEVEALSGLRIHTLHSHLACADEDHVLNARQLQRFAELRQTVTADRYSLANSAGIYLGRDFAFDLVRPGLALYGGIPRAEARNEIRPVVTLEAQVIQVRRVHAGESVGYNATYIAQDEMAVAIINLGYADGYWRAFSSRGHALTAGCRLPVIGRISMDLVALDCRDAAELSAGDWVTLDFELEQAAALTGFSQYELLTGLGQRLERLWS